MSIETLRQLTPQNTAAIDYLERDGAVFVTVIDRHGDSHMHRLVAENLSRSQVLDLLKAKQAELARHE